MDRRLAKEVQVEQTTTGQTVPPNTDVRDVTIIGGGPTGLSAAYYAGHREASVRIIDTLPELGGQVMAVYPEKHVFDVAGFPKIQGAELCRLLTEQAMQFCPDVVLDVNCETFEYVDARPNDTVDRIIKLGTSDGRTFYTRTLIVTAGHGAFEPRRLGVENIDKWHHKGLHYVVRRKQEFADKRIVIVGGGDSALDWTLGLQDTTPHPITLVHRRERFRALESSVSQMQALAERGQVNLIVPAEVTDVHGNGVVRGVTITDSETGATQEVPCDALVTLLGFKSALGSIADWGLEFLGRKTIKVDPSMATNLPNVFAAGDVAGYEGKITLITVGMGEAAIAANWAITKFRPEARVQPKYSTE